MTAGRTFWLVPFVAIATMSCNSQPEPADYVTLPARFAEEGPAEPMEALEAFRDESSFYVRYRIGEEIRYTGGEWSDRIPLDSIAAGGNHEGTFVVPLGYHRTDPWAKRPAEPVAATILSSRDWQVFRDGLLTSLVPVGGHEGIVLHFYVDDYFLYYDEQGVFRSVLLVDKPPDYEIGRQISFGEFLEDGVPLLEKYLEGKGIADRRILFNTGDTGRYSLPFLYVNLDLPLAAFARHVPPGRTADPGPAVPVLQAAGHLTQSHSASMMVRPVSSIYRLLFVAREAVTETVRPDWLVALEETPIPPVSEGPGMDLAEWEARLDELTGREASSGTIEYLVDGERFFPRLIDTVNDAQSSIDLRTYIFDNDDYAERIGELLKRRSNEGIDVRMLFDGFGTIVSTIERQQTLPEDWKGTASVHTFLESESEIDVRQSPNPWFTGDHVKTIIIDRQVAFTGGMNIAREYRYDWHDLMMEVHGSVVGILQHEFNKAWAHAGSLGDFGYFVRRLMPVPDDADRADEGDYPIRVLFTRVDDPEIFRVQREAIRNAKRYIYVENAYFTDDAMLYELVKARRRGVDVRVIMPLVTDRGPISRNNALAANVMLEHGIRVFVYPGMSHVKAAVFDGWASLGSANWDKWSLSINKELNLATSDPAAVRPLLEQVFDLDFAVSPELKEPFPERWSDYLLEFIGDYVF
jgi:cardiolipin synthase